MSAKSSYKKYENWFFIVPSGRREYGRWRERDHAHTPRRAAIARGL
jgi:hypothetical protein